MQRLVYLIFLVICVPSYAQIITTIAGNGTGGDGSPAISASVHDPNGLAFDKYGNLFFAEQLGNFIRKIDTSGIISTVAGIGASGYSGENVLAIASKLNQPINIAIDTIGNIYFADCANNRIRKITVATGIITTVAGNGIGTFAGDNGQATDASLYNPSGICFDDVGNLYIADYANNRVRKVTSNGIITTFAGIGVIGWAGDNGQATRAKCTPVDIRMDASDNLYIVDYGNGGSHGGTVRKVNTAGIITTVAGDTTSYIFNFDEIPATQARMNPQFLTLDRNGILYISDYTNNRIRMVGSDGIIHTIIGTGVAGNAGDNGSPSAAKIYYPSGMAFDSCQNLFFNQVGIPRIRKVTFNPYCWPLALNEVKEPKTISIFPTPTTNLLHITGLKETATFTLYEMTGRAVMAGALLPKENEINISNLAMGMYMLQVQYRDGQREIRKIVKE